LNHHGHIAFAATWAAFPEARGKITFNGRDLVADALCADFSQSTEATDEGLVYSDSVTVRILQSADDKRLKIGAVIGFKFRRGRETHSLRIHGRAISGGIVRLTCEAVAK
jgi:hypothetical protein